MVEGKYNLNQIELNNSIQLDLTTLLKLIPDFDTNYPEQIYRFIRSCDSAFSLSSPEQSPIILVYALNKITGTGASDVHCRQYLDWNELKAYLIPRFSNIKTIAHLNLELQSMFQKPNETLTQYFHRVDLCRSKIIEKLTAEITDQSIIGRKLSTEETALSVFVNGLSSDIGIMLRTKQFNNLSDAGKFAMQEDKIRSMNNARQILYKNSKISPVTMPKPQNIVQFQPNKQPYKPIINTNSSFDASKICNYCKKVGHLIGECRRRAFNNSNRPSTSNNNNFSKSNNNFNKPYNNFNTNFRTNNQQARVNNLNSEATNELSNSLENANMCSTHEIQDIENLQLQ